MSINLPVHQIFGTAIGLRRNGAPIWPIRGASPEGDPPADAPPPQTPAPDPTPPDPAPDPVDDNLGDPGKKALDAERQARKDAEKALKAAQAAVKAYEDAKKTDAEKQAERIAGLEKDAAKALRYEAAEKAGLSLSLAQRLNGSTLDEMIADAKEFKALIGGGAAQTSTTETKETKTPKPDRRQGGGGGEVSGSMASGRAAYEARKNRN
ncbi:hypothetical protein [Nocardia sp. NPDC004711]